MTDQEAEAIKWMESVRDDAVVTLDHIKREEPNVSPMLYEGRKAKAETILKGFEELGQYRAVGTAGECQKAIEKQRAKKPQLYGGFEDGKLLCPSCGEDLMDLVECGFNCCPYCGQAIGWLGSEV